MLGIGNEVPASKYLNDLLDKLTNRGQEEVKHEIRKVLKKVKSHEKKFQSTPPVNPQPTKVSTSICP